MVSEFQSLNDFDEPLLSRGAKGGNLSGYFSLNKMYDKVWYTKNQNNQKKKPKNKLIYKSWIINIITAKTIIMGNVLRIAFFLNNLIILRSISFSVFKVAIQLYSYKFIDLSVADFRKKQYV